MVKGKREYIAAIISFIIVLYMGYLNLFDSIGDDPTNTFSLGVGIAYIGLWISVLVLTILWKGKKLLKYSYVYWKISLSFSLILLGLLYLESLGKYVETTWAIPVVWIFYLPIYGIISFWNEYHCEYHIQSLIVAGISLCFILAIIAIKKFLNLDKKEERKSQ